MGLRRIVSLCGRDPRHNAQGFCLSTAGADGPHTTLVAQWCPERMGLRRRWGLRCVNMNETMLRHCTSRPSGVRRK